MNLFKKVILRPLDPKLWIRLRTSYLALDPSPIIIMTEDTPIMIPMLVRDDRSLFLINARKADLNELSMFIDKT